MKKLTLPTILLLTLLTFSCSLILQEETTDVNFTISREAFARNGAAPNAKYKVDCFLTGGVNDSQTLYLDESQKQGTFTFEKIPIGKKVNVKVRVYEYKEEIGNYWLMYGGLDSTRIQQKDNYLNIALNPAITITYVNSEDENQKTTQRVIANEATNLDACSFTSTTSGFTCIGWQSGDTKKVDYTDGQRVSFSDDTTLKTIFTNAQGYKFGNISIDGTVYNKTHDVVVIPKYTVGIAQAIPLVDSVSAYDTPENAKIQLSPFAIGAYEVTQELWQAVMNENPSFFDGTDESGELDFYTSFQPYNKSTAEGENQNLRPVDSVCWYECLVFCNKLSMKCGFDPCYTINGKTDPDEWGEIPVKRNETWDAVELDISKNGYRLPIETEWSFAARGGDPTKPDWNYKQSGTQSSLPVDDYYKEVPPTDPALEPYAWYDNNSDNRTHEVGLKRPNRLGLYDMNGNVAEACYNNTGWSNYFALKMKETNSEVIINPLGYSFSSSDYCRHAKGASWASIGYMLSIDDLYSAIVIPKDYEETEILTGIRLVRSLVD